MKLLIVSECGHFRSNGRVLAPRHFVREISLWASMFSQVRLITRFPPWHVPGDGVVYECSNLEFAVGNGALTGGLVDFLLSLGRSAVAVVRIVLGFAWADVVHIRCPARHGLFALLLLRVIGRPCYVKWAGNWDVGRGAPLSVRLQRGLIRRMGGPVVATVYGRMRDDPPHIHETATTSLSQREVEECLAIERSEPSRGISLLWVGRFSPNKNVSALFEVLERVLPAFPLARLDLVGIGEELPLLTAEAQRRGLGERVVFHGSQPWDHLREHYARATLLLLPSFSEGFPKVVMEAALFGTPSVVFAVGALPQIVAGRGVAVQPPGDISAFADAVNGLLADSQRWSALSHEARRWAAGISIEAVVDGYRRLIEVSWGVVLPAAIQAAE